MTRKSGSEKPLASNRSLRAILGSGRAQERPRPLVARPSRPRVARLARPARQARQARGAQLLPIMMERLDVLIFESNHTSKNSIFTLIAPVNHTLLSKSTS